MSLFAENGNEIEQLLGRKPKVPFSVAVRCPDGTAQVLLAAPVYFEEEQWKPFPTIFWLVCPRLKHRISQLEQNGFVQAAALRLESDPEFLSQYMDGQQRIAGFRVKRAREVAPQSLTERNLAILTCSSIAGSRDPRGIKCLHAHAAQALAFGYNPVGSWVLAETGSCSSAVPCGKSVAHQATEAPQ